jgi:tetratricopeptide (TPR) repeat protein
MIEPRRILAPLDEAGDAVEILSGYEGAAELGGAITAVWDAVDRSLRLLLRSDAHAPDAVRLAALSRDELPLSRVVAELRDRDLISMELAGRAHELDQAAGRAARGEVRAADADLARGVVAQLRTDVSRAGERGVRSSATRAVHEGAFDEAIHTVPPPSARQGMRRFALLAAIVAALSLVVFATVILLSWGEDLDRAVEAFRGGQLQVAESRFREVVARHPENATAHLYLGRIYRRQQRYENAAESLRQAARYAPGDPLVSRELGYLFLELNRPASAAEYFQRAVEVEPEERLNWIGLIRSLRAAGDLRAEEVLRRAPADVRASVATHQGEP